MSEPQPQPDPPATDAGIKAGAPPQTAMTPVEPVAYRPVSGWAVAGFGAGVFFSLFTVLTTVVALWQGVPFFLHPSIVFIAVAGVVLSLLGQRHVQNSEGTRAGATLAQLGLWLSLVSGLSYFSYFFVTGLALQNQANAFLMEKTDDDSGFFPRLREGATDPVQLNTAFLLARNPRDRAGVKPEDERELLRRFDIGKGTDPGEFSFFKYGTGPQSFYSSLPRIFYKGNAKDVKIFEQGVQEWKYEQKTYMVTRKYRIEAKDIQWDVVVMVCSAEGESAGQGRKWYVNFSSSGITARTPTPFGLGMKNVRLQAMIETDLLIQRLNRGEAFNEIKELDQTSWDGRFGQDALAKRDFIQRLFQDKSEKRIEQFKLWASSPDEAGGFEEIDGKLRLYLTFRFVVPKSVAVPTGYLVDGYVVQESMKAVDPIQHTPTSPSPGWRLMQIVFTNVRETPQIEQKGGM